MLSNRPADNRPQHKDNNGSVRTSATPAAIRPLFAELLSTRTLHEVLPTADGSFFERAILIDRLRELRSDLAKSRRSIR